jgi:hypothetical protein
MLREEKKKIEKYLYNQIKIEGVWLQCV